MVRRYEVTDEQWKIIEPHLGNKAKRTGRPQADNRKLFNGVLWILRTGAPWRDLPEYYGPWQTVYKRFAQWQENGKLKALFDQLREGADMQDLCIDGTYIKAHRAECVSKFILTEIMQVIYECRQGKQSPGTCVPACRSEWRRDETL